MVVNNITIKDSLYFEFNGKKSKDFKIMNVSLNGGMQEEYFSSSQTVNTEKAKGRNKTYYQSNEKDVLKLNVNFAKDGKWTKDELREIRRWLTEPEYYSPLIFSDDPEKIYYAIYVDDSTLTHVSDSGYITISFICNDAYAYSPIMTKKYIWEYEDKYEQVISDFSTGSKNTMIIDENGYLSLNPVKKMLRDYPSETKLYEIG